MVWKKTAEEKRVSDVGNQRFCISTHDIHDIF